MIGPAIEKGSSRYDEAQYRLSFHTEDGLKAQVHVNKVTEKPRLEYEVCAQGDKLYGLIAFYLYTYSWENEKPHIRRSVPGTEWTYGPS